MSQISKVLNFIKDGDLIFIARSRNDYTWESVAFCNKGNASYTVDGKIFNEDLASYLDTAEKNKKPIGLFRLEPESSSFVQRVQSRLLKSPGIIKDSVNLLFLAFGKSPKFPKVLAQLGLDISLIVLQELRLNGSSIKHLHDSGKLVRLL